MSRETVYAGRSFFLALSLVLPLGVCAQQADPPAARVDTALLTGFLKVRAAVDSFYVVVDQDFRRATLWRSGDSLELRAGYHQVTIVNERMSDYHVSVRIVADSVMLLSVPAQTRPKPLKSWQNAAERLRKGRNLEVVTDYDTDVYLDGRWIGRGFATADTAQGRYRLEFRNQTTGNHRRWVDLRAARLTAISSYARPAAVMVRVLSPIPGGAQLYQREAWKALGLGVSGAVAGTLALQQRGRFESLNQQYQSTLTAYRAAATEAEAYELGLKARRLGASMRSAARTRDIAAGALVATVIISVVDAWRRPPGGFRRDGPPTSESALKVFVGPPGPGLAFTVRF